MLGLSIWNRKPSKVVAQVFNIAIRSVMLIISLVDCIEILKSSMFDNYFSAFKRLK